MRLTLLRLSALAGLLSLLTVACAPTTPPGEKDRERGEDALDRLPK